MFAFYFRKIERNLTSTTHIPPGVISAIMVNTRSAKAAPPSPTFCAGRKRKVTEAIAEPRNPKKARSAEESPDALYLQQSIVEFSKHRPSRKSHRHQVMEMAQNFLTRFEMPKARDSHNFDTTPAARAFLASDVAIKKPVFVSGDAANYSSIDPDSDTRPIEQFLNCLHDLDQEYEYVDESKSEYRSQAFTKVRDVKKRFLNNTQSPRYPRNFPDIANPMPDHGIPHFMRSGSNTVLHDIMRQYLAVPLQDICTCGDKDPETKHCGHTVSLASLQALQCGWMDWQGTAMLAEPGAVTHPHWDKYGTSTWIACLEGEIGFGWQAASPMAIRSSYLANESEPTGRWLFKVLRPGDAVYMPSGTVRFVFRRPKGGQTLGFAAQMLRRGDLAAWMEALKVEMEYSIEGVLADENDTPYHLIVPKLFEGLLRLIGHACEEGGYEKFGGLPKIEALLDLVEECDDVANALVEVQRRRQADANSIAAES